MDGCILRPKHSETSKHNSYTHYGNLPVDKILACEYQFCQSVHKITVGYIIAIFYRKILERKVVQSRDEYGFM